MAVDLGKGSKVNLSKQKQGLSRVMVGLGWDPVKESGNSLKDKILAFINGKSNESIDCDAWISLRGSTGYNKDNIVYYGNRTFRHYGETVVYHHGDNLTGEGDGDDEVISVYLDKVPDDINELIIGVTIFRGAERNQSFSNIDNVFVRVVDGESGTTLVKFVQKEMSGLRNETTFIAGKIYREQGDWHFEAIGRCTNDKNILSAVQNYK